MLNCEVYTHSLGSLGGYGVNRIGRKNTITRKNLVYSLVTGLIIGVIAGVPFGVAHRFYAEQRLADVLICRERTETYLRHSLRFFAVRDSEFSTSTLIRGRVNPTEPLGTIV